MPTKRSPAPKADDAKAAKRPKQRSLASTFASGAAAAASDATRAPPAVVTDAALPLLRDEFLQELDNACDNYRAAWGEKCCKSSNLARGGAARTDIDLDGRGLHLVASFRSAAQLAAARRVGMPPQFLDALVLVVRNDVVHSSSHVSRAAAAALGAYLAENPYTAVARHPEDLGGHQYVALAPHNAWLPFEGDRSGFTSKYLMNEDMALSGRNWRADSGAPGAPKRQRDTPWRCPAELVLHCVRKGLASAEVDFNGDLQILSYLLAVMEQDLAARVKVFEALGAAEGRESSGIPAPARGGLLENSLAWRLYAGPLVGAETRQDLVRSLVELTACWDEAAAEGDIDAAAEEPEDDAPAGACVFTRGELAALAARTLRLLLHVFGSAEGAGAFLAHGAHRAAAVNHRMALDAALLEAAWSEKGVCKRAAAAAALLRALAPRDALRLLGLLTAQKFCRTYDASSLGHYGKIVGDLAPPMHAAHSMLTRGTDVGTFFQVDLCPAVATLHREPARAAKSYKGADHLAVVIAAMAAAAAALAAAGEDVPTGAEGMTGLKGELQVAARALVGLAAGGADGAAHLTGVGLAELVAAQMTIAAM